MSMTRSATAIAAAPTRTRRRASAGTKLLRKLTPYLYVSPATALLVLLMLFPMIMVVRYSLMDGAIMKKDAAFAGLSNYITIFENRFSGSRWDRPSISP